MDEPNEIDRTGTRRAFLRGAGATGALAWLGASAVAPAGAGAASGQGGDATADGAAPAGPLASWYPRQDPALVEKVVAAAHRDFDSVHELVRDRPELAKAQWDWGFGDWESALGAASHTGRRDIAELLLRHGARPTLFSAAMLGQLEVVRAFVAASPGIQGTPGPHGIPLLAHARAGGAPAAAVAAYLEAVGGADAPPAPTPLGAAERAAYVGTYRFGIGPRAAFAVAEVSSGLTIARLDGTPRGLAPMGDHVFHPAGAPGVRVRFEISDGTARALTVHDPAPSVRAVRHLAPG